MSPFRRLARGICLAIFLIPTSSWSHGLFAQVEPESGINRSYSSPEGAEGRLSDWARKHLLELSASQSSDGMDVPSRLERIRAMYFLSVDEGDWLDPAKDSLKVLATLGPDSLRTGIVIRGYQGAFEIIRAKHSRWPPNKLKYLKAGARVLDDLVAEHPQHLEIRYLRLASYLFLPSFLRREESTEADIRILASALPQETESFSPPIYEAVLLFLLENGGLEGESRARLENALKSRPAVTGAQNNGR